MVFSTRFLKNLKKILTFILSILILILIIFVFQILVKNGLSKILTSIIIFYAFNACANSFVVFYATNNSSKITWFFVLNVLPFFGHIIFIFIGRHNKKQISLIQYQQKLSFQFENNNCERHKRNDYYFDLLKKQSFLTKRGVYDCQLYFYRNGEQAFQAMFDDMERANSYIYIHYYIIRNGEIYDQFKKTLIQKAAAGIEIKILVDDFGRSDLSWKELKTLKNHGIEIEIFKKAHFPFISLDNVFRTHRKMVLIDGEIVHTGGMNISDEYASFDKKFGLWIDSQVQIKGEAAKSYLLLFVDDWKKTSDQTIEIATHIPSKYFTYGKTLTTLVEESPDIKTKMFHNSLVWWIMNAKKTIKLVTPYFIPTPEILEALKTVALLGVKISIVIPGKADIAMVHNATLYWVEKLLEYENINIWITKNIMIHSKMGIFDDTYAYMGTANIDFRSFYYQYETINFFTGQGVFKMNQEYDYYLTLSQKYFQQSSIIKRKLWGFVAKIASPIF